MSSVFVLLPTWAASGEFWRRKVGRDFFVTTRYYAHNLSSSNFDWIKEFQPRPVNLSLGPIFWLVLSLSRLRLGSRLILGSRFFSVSLSLWSSALNCRPWPLFVSFGLPLWSDFCFAVQRVKG